MTPITRNNVAVGSIGYVHANGEIQRRFCSAGVRLTALVSTSLDDGDKTIIRLCGPVAEHLRAIRTISGLYLLPGATPTTYHSHEGHTFVEMDYNLKNIRTNIRETASATFARLFDIEMEGVEGVL